MVWYGMVHRRIPTFDPFCYSPFIDRGTLRTLHRFRVCQIQLFHWIPHCFMRIFFTNDTTRTIETSGLLFTCEASQLVPKSIRTFGQLVPDLVNSYPIFGQHVPPLVNSYPIWSTHTLLKIIYIYIRREICF